MLQKKTGKTCPSKDALIAKLAFIGKGTGLTEVVFVFLQRTLTFLDNQLALVLGQSTNCCEPKPTCMHSVNLSHGHPLL